MCSALNYGLFFQCICYKKPYWVFDLGCLKTAKLFHVMQGPKTNNVLLINLVYINQNFYFLNNFNKIQYFNEPVCAENKCYVQAILCSYSGKISQNMDSYTIATKTWPFSYWCAVAASGGRGHSGHAPSPKSRT